MWKLEEILPYSTVRPNLHHKKRLPLYTTLVLVFFHVYNALIPRSYYEIITKLLGPKQALIFFTFVVENIQTSSRLKISLQ